MKSFIDNRKDTCVKINGLINAADFLLIKLVGPLPSDPVSKSEKGPEVKGHIQELREIDRDEWSLLCVLDARLEMLKSALGYDQPAAEPTSGSIGSAGGYR